MKPKIDGDQIYATARAFCYGVAKDAVTPLVRENLADFSIAERLIIEALAEWMGSRDCEIAKLSAYPPSAPPLAVEVADAVTAWLDHAPTCDADPCVECDQRLHRVRLTSAMWNARKAVA